MSTPAQETPSIRLYKRIYPQWCDHLPQFNHVIRAIENDLRQDNDIACMVRFENPETFIDITSLEDISLNTHLVENVAWSLAKHISMLVNHREDLLVGWTGRGRYDTYRHSNNGQRFLLGDEEVLVATFRADAPIIESSEEEESESESESEEEEEEEEENEWSDIPPAIVLNRDCYGYCWRLDPTDETTLELINEEKRKCGHDNIRRLEGELVELRATEERLRKYQEENRTSYNCSMRTGGRRVMRQD